jgi:hypothetical protein
VRDPQEEGPCLGIFEGFRIGSQDYGSVAKCHPEVRLHFKRTTPVFESLYSPARNFQAIAKIVQAQALGDIGNLCEFLVRDRTAKIEYLAR